MHMKALFGTVCGRRTALTAASIALAAALWWRPLPASASEPVEAYPAKPIRMLVPIAAGGGTDILARQLAAGLAPILKQSVFVENRAGANGVIGSQAAARAAPDGYTIFVGSSGTLGANEFLYPNLGFDPARDFVPITVVAVYNNVLIVPASSPIKTFGELIEQARRQPGKLNYGITVIGNSSHFAAEQWKRDAKLDVVGVPYNGAVPATVDLMGGRTQFMFDVIVGQHGNITAGKVRALATTALERSRALPDVPTIAESGFPGFESVGWVGLFAPTGTPPAIVNKIFAAVKSVYAQPELERTLGSRGLVLVTSPSPKSFGDYVVEERAKTGKLIRDANIKAD
jgi:tripartite-type tricarboxylate transporter receptor subunit TctC